jgi:hypothetical protein
MRIFIGPSENQFFGNLDERDGLLMRDRGELLEELAERVACGEVVEKVLDGDPRTAEDGGATHHVGRDCDDGVE